MAENNNNRKSKRNFSLEKPIERHFDIEKEVETAPVAPAPPVKLAQAKPSTGVQQKSEVTPQKLAQKQQGKDVPPTTPTGGNKDGKGDNNSLKWIFIALFAAALAACAYFFMNDNKSNEEIPPQPTQNEQNDSIQDGNNATDSITNSEKETEEGIVEESNETTGENAETSQEESNNFNEPVSQPSTSDNNNQSARNPSVTQGTSSTQASNSAPNASSIEQKAKDVWKGVYGNNPDRRRNLGADYEAVQKLVNEMHRHRSH